MKKKKIQTIIIIAFFLLKTMAVFSQQESNMELRISLPLCNVTNSQIYKAIDSVAFYASDCVFSVLKKPHYYSILLWSTTHIEISVLPYSTPELYYYLYDPRNKNMGLTYYNDKTILIIDRANLFSQFFQVTDNIIFLKYENSSNLLDLSIISGQKTSIHYKYQEGNFLIDDEDDIEFCNINPHYPYRFIYLIKQGDTKESIAKVCGCTVEELFDGYPPPIEGFLIVADYHIKNGKLINVVRVQ